MNNPLRVSCRILCGMTCDEVMDEIMDEVFEPSGKEELSLLQRLRVGLHLFVCPRCNEEARKLAMLKEIGQSDFFPSALSSSIEEIEEKVMAQIAGQAGEGFPQDEVMGGLIPEVPGGLSFRSWVIIGCIILVSLSTSFFGIDFIEAAFNRDSSFLIPLGITVGTVVTGYGAFFIAGHLKELSAHFKIH